MPHHRLLLKEVKEEEQELQMELVAPSETKTQKVVRTLLRKKKKTPAVMIKRAYCDRRNGTIYGWILKTTDGRKLKVKQAVLKKASFSCDFTSVGCGGFYRGFADGQYHGNIDAITNRNGGRELIFSMDQGKFFDKQTRREITSVSNLVLLPNCKAKYYV